MKFPIGRDAFHVSDCEQFMSKFSMSSPGRKVGKTNMLSLFTTLSLLNHSVALSLSHASISDSGIKLYLGKFLPLAYCFCTVLA